MLPFWAQFLACILLINTISYPFLPSYSLFWREQSKRSFLKQEVRVHYFSAKNPPCLSISLKVKADLFNETNKTVHDLNLFFPQARCPTTLPLAHTSPAIPSLEHIGMLLASVSGDCSCCQECSFPRYLFFPVYLIPSFTPSLGSSLSLKDTQTTS